MSGALGLESKCALLVAASMKLRAAARVHIVYGTRLLGDRRPPRPMERRLTGRVSAILVAVLAAVVFTGCSSQVALENPALPDPLLNQLPLKVAVRYSPEMSRYVHEEEVLGRQKWTIDLGAANQLAFRHLFGSMFSEVVEVDADTDVEAVGADALIEASIEAFEFALPAQSRSDAYTIWIRYRLRIFDDEGTEISNWPIAAYGKAGAEGMFSADEALSRAAVLAMRDAAAMIGLRFARETGLGDPGGSGLTGTGSEKAESLNAQTDPAVESKSGAVTVVAPPESDVEVESAPPADVEPPESADVAANTDDTSQANFQGNYIDDRG